MEIAIDFGITNTDILVSNKTERIYSSIQSEEINNDFLKKIFDLTNLDPNKIKKIAVTGGKSANLNNTFKDIPIFKVNEVEAIGLGAKNLYSINDEKFVVISAGAHTLKSAISESVIMSILCTGFLRAGRSKKPCGLLCAVCPFPSCRQRQHMHP